MRFALAIYEPNPGFLNHLTDQRRREPRRPAQGEGSGGCVPRHGHDHAYAHVEDPVEVARLEPRLPRHQAEDGLRGPAPDIDVGPHPGPQRPR